MLIYLAVIRNQFIHLKNIKGNKNIYNSIYKYSQGNRSVLYVPQFEHVNSQVLPDLVSRFLVKTALERHHMATNTSSLPFYEVFFYANVNFRWVRSSAQQLGAPN